MIRRRTLRAASFAPLLLVLLAACDGGALPIQVEAREMPNGPADQIELFVKSEPGVDLTYDGTTESTGESPNHSFKVPKSKLKLGKNELTVTGTGGGFPGKRTGSATATLDVTPKMVLHFQSPPNAVNEGTFTCAGAMCGATSIMFTKAGAMPLALTSDIAATVTVEGKKVTLAAGAPQTIPIDLVAKLADTPIGSGNDDVLLSVAIEANGEKANAALTLRGNGMTDLATREFRKVEQGPYLFAGEQANSDPPDAMIVVGAPSAPLIVVGKPKTFRDVDLVGVGTPSDHTFACPNGAPLQYVDLQVKVYARRTGALVGTKNLSADRTTCPPTPAATPLKSVVREDDTKKVLSDFLKK